MKKPAAPSIQPRRHSGFTLIEVMVALIVLVLGVLGAAAMTLTALRDGKQSSLRSQATAMAYELGDLMRMAGSGQESVFTTSTPGGVIASCYTTGCAPSDMASSDYYQWIAKLTYSGAAVTAGTPASGLPNATYKVCRDATSLSSMTTCDNNATSPIVIKIRWDEKNNNGTIDSSVGPRVVIELQPY